MTHEEATTILRQHGVCLCCHQNTTCCVATFDDVESHERYWQANNVTARRPWWSRKEMARILLGQPVR